MDNSITASFEITRVTFQSPDGEYCIVQARLDDDQEPSAVIPQWARTAKSVGLVGVLPGAGVGDLFEVTGEVTTHPRYGRQVKVALAERSVKESDRAVEAFLRGFPNIGPKRAGQITKEFGGFRGVIDVLDNAPMRLTTIPGITPDRADEIAQAYATARGRRDALLFCCEHKFAPRLSAQVIRVFSGDARAKITENPYVLMSLRGVGFKDADTIARNTFGVGVDDVRRCAAAALHCLNAACSDGHTYVVKSAFMSRAREEHSRDVQRALADVSSLSREQLSAGFDALNRETVAREGDRIYPIALYAAECTIAAKLRCMLAAV